MSLIEHYRTLYEYEKDCNLKILMMLESVPEPRRGDSHFSQAIMLAGHLAVCRENWLTCMAGESRVLAASQKESSDLDTLYPRFAALESRWMSYLTGLDESRLTEDFEFSEAGSESFRLPIGVQIEQLAGHAAYHRGQIVFLVAALGGETTDTDYADWWWAKRYEAES